MQTNKLSKAEPDHKAFSQSVAHASHDQLSTDENPSFHTLTRSVTFAHTNGLQTLYMGSYLMPNYSVT